MKKRILFLSILITCSIPTFSQITWDTVMGITPLKINSIAINNAGEIVAARDTGSVIYSNNNGLDWSYRSIHDTLLGQIKKLKFAPNGDLFATSNHNIYRSSNTGQIWTKLNFHTYYSIYDFDIDSIGRMYVLIDSFGYEDKVLFTSINNGTTWSLISVPLPTVVAGDPYTYITAIGNGELFLSNDDLESQFSLDNGATWQSSISGGVTFTRVAKDPTTGEYYCIDFINGANLYKVTQWLPSITVTQTQIPLPVMGQQSEMLISSSGDKIIWSYHNYGDLYYQLHGTSTWTLVNQIMNNGVSCAPVFNATTGYYFFGMSNPNNTVINGVYPFKLAYYYPPYIDAGTSNNNPNGASNLYSQAGSNTIYARDNTYKVYYTVNQGISWRSLPDTNRHSYGGSFQNEFMYNNIYTGDEYICDNTPFIGRKPNGIDYSYTLSVDTIINYIDFAPNGDLYCTKNGSKRIFKSSDYGATWQALPMTLPINYSGPGSVNCNVTPQGNLLSVGYRSIDGGLTWQPVDSIGSLIYKYFKNRNSGVLYGLGHPSVHSEQIYESTDDGMTWQLILPDTYFGSGIGILKDLIITDCGDLYLSTLMGPYFSNDNGASWSPLISGPPSVNMALNSSGYLYLSNNYIRHSSLPIPSSQNCTPVWPGDANYDFIVNNTDLLPIGLYYGQTGIARTVQGNAWQADTCANWGTMQVNSSDLKHADCNGDGTIDNNDTLAVNLNFSLTHAIAPNTINQEKINGPDLYFVTGSTSYHAGDMVDVEVWAGSATMPIRNLYGVAFDINYTSSFVQPGTESITYPTSWLGTPGTDVIKIGTVDALAATAYGAVTRINHRNANGYGKIADFKFQASTSITSTSFFHLSISSYMANDSSGTGQLFNVINDTLAFLPVSASGINQLASDNDDLIIAPNPFSNQTTLFFSHEQKNTTIKITDIIGKELKTINFTGKQYILEKGEMKRGVYFLRIENEKKEVVTRKLVIQ